MAQSSEIKLLKRFDQDVEITGNIVIGGNFTNNINIVKNNVGIPTTYSAMSIEATDAQLDLISSASGTWGSSINLVEGTSSTANTNVWSIARHTTGGSGDSGLYFNFGAGNQHDNSNRVKFSSSGDITAQGTVNSDGLVIDGVSWNSGKVRIEGVSPNIEFRDSDTGSYWFQLGSNAKRFYILHDTDLNGVYETTYPFELRSDTSIGYVFGSRIFADNYHPNADKWTTARTLTLNGDVSGSVSWDGSANATLTVTVANNSHSHNYIERVSTVNSNYNFNDLYANDQLRFHSTYATNGNWTTASVTNYPSTPTVTSAYGYGATLSLRNNGQGMFQIYAPHNQNGNSDMFFRTGWNTDFRAWARMWTDRNHGSGSGLDADLLDGQHASSFASSSHTHSGSDITTGTIDGSRLEWYDNDGFNGTYPIVWTSSDGLYRSTWFQIRGSDDTILTRNINTGASYTVVSSSFVDADDTSYYLNPSGASRLSQARFAAGHGDTRVELYYDDATSASNDAQLLLWASEPGISYNGGGIGANIDYNGQYYGRFSTLADYGVYMRLRPHDGVISFSHTTGTPDTSGASRTENFFINASGNTQSRTSSRAPIFYDSNNTAFYVNPADTTMSARLAGRMELYGTAPVLEMNDSNATNTTDLISYISFQRQDSERGYVGYASGTNDYFYINNADGIIYNNASYTLSTGSSRAPIFYDSDNTSYYLNPTGESYLSGRINIKGVSADWNTSTPGLTKGTIHLDPENSTDNYGNAITFGASDAGAGDNSHAGIYVRSDGNYGTKMYLATTNSYASGSKVAIEIDHNGHIFAQRNSVRAGIFYDINDTTYYGDFASTSRMNVLNTNVYKSATSTNNGRFESGGDWGTRHMTDSGYIQFGPANSSWAHIYTDRDYYYLNKGLTIGDGSYVNQNDIRSKIFYDKDNTAYYLDLNNTSQFGAINMNGTLNMQSRSITNAADSSFNGDISLISGGIGSNADGASTANQVTRILVPEGGAGSWDSAQTGAIKIRLPIRANNNMWSMKVRIYDYGVERTQEYLLGNYSYSNGGYNSSVSFNGGKNATPRTVRFGNDGTYDCVWIGETNTSWSYPVVSILDFQAGFRGASIGTNVDNYDISIVTSFGTVQTAYNPDTKAGYDVYAQSSFRAPIFYDSDNTNYYVNPASTSVMQKVLSYDGYKCNTEKGMVGNYDAAGTADKIIWTIGDSWNSLSSHYGIGYDYDGTYGHHLVFRNNGSSYSRIPFASQAALFSGGTKAPIYYDSDNTARYVDPAGTSVLSTTDFKGTVALSFNELRLAGLSDGNHYLKKISTGYSGSTVDGPQLQGHQGGELTTNYTGNNWALRWAIGGNVFVNNTLSVGGDVIAYYSSDKRLKDNIKPIDNAIDKVQKISGVTFDWNDKQDTYEHGKHDVGVIAQEIEEVLPEVVDTRENGYKAVKYEKIVPLLIEAIKEQQKQIDELKKLINP